MMSNYINISSIEIFILEKFEVGMILHNANSRLRKYESLAWNSEQMNLPVSVAAHGGGTCARKEASVCE